MPPIIVFSVIAFYFGILILISWLTSRKANMATFFTANRQSPWYVVAFGMIGATLSGVTFISLPGEVGNTNFHYYQLVFGYLLGYFFIGTVLMPLYYRLNLVTIYTYLNRRFGIRSYKSGSAFFLLSRTVGGAFRLFIVATVLQIAFFQAYNIPFFITVIVTLLLIWLYTYRAGIKTVVYTDTLQTFFMLASFIVSAFIIKNALGFSFGEMVTELREHPYTKMFEWDWQAGQNFFKQFFSGAFIAVVMTGLDQDMMQKNLTCKNIKEAQKNMFWFTLVLLPVNLLFMSVGVLLYMYANAKGIPIPESSDRLYPILALNHFNIFAGIVFLLGIIAAAFSSADSALTSLTTAFCVDFLNIDINKDTRKARNTKIGVHWMFTAILFIVIVVFNSINDQSVLSALFKIAGYTYGPILGLFMFGLFTRFNLRDKWVPLVVILSPVISFVIDYNSEAWFGGYQFSYELLVLNGLITFIGLWLLSIRQGKVLTNANQKPIN